MAKMIGKPVKDPKKKKMLTAPKRGKKVIGRPVKGRMPKKGTPGGGGASGYGPKLEALKNQRDDQMGTLGARAQLKMAQQKPERTTAVMPTRKPKKGSRDPRKQYMGGGSVGVKHYNSIFDID
jgi:hypothetical protein